MAKHNRVRYYQQMNTEKKIFKAFFFSRKNTDIFMHCKCLIATNYFK